MDGREIIIPTARVSHIGTTQGFVFMGQSKPLACAGFDNPQQFQQ
jgi:hypothetical protein